MKTWSEKQVKVRLIVSQAHTDTKHCKGKNMGKSAKIYLKAATIIYLLELQTQVHAVEVRWVTMSSWRLLLLLPNFIPGHPHKKLLASFLFLQWRGIETSLTKMKVEISEFRLGAATTWFPHNYKPRSPIQ